MSRRTVFVLDFEEREEERGQLMKNLKVNTHREPMRLPVAESQALVYYTELPPTALGT